MRKLVLLLGLIIGSLSSCLADSPLTSISFFPAYLDVPIIKETSQKPGKLSEKAMAFLYNDANPLDKRLALINAVGWDFDGITAYEDYMDYCMWQNKEESNGVVEVPAEETIIQDASPDQLAVLIYLSAMSDYFDMSVPYYIASFTHNYPNNKQSYMLPIALMLSQISMDSDWCEVYRTVKDLFYDAPVKDMRPKAVNMIMEYIDLYKNYCN